MKNTVSWVAGVALQANLRGNEGGGSRLWLFSKSSGMLFNIFNENFGWNILRGQQNIMPEYQDIKVTFGLAFLFAFHKKHKVK